jgi:uncharacterized protein
MDDQSTDQRSPRSVVQQLLDGITVGPTRELADLYAEEAVVVLPFAQPGGLRLEGKAALADHFERSASLPLRLAPINITLHLTDDPETVIAEYDYDVTSAIGTHVRTANVQIVKVRSGLIVDSRDFHDHAALAAALQPEPLG